MEITFGLKEMNRVIDKLFGKIIENSSSVYVKWMNLYKEFSVLDQEFKKRKRLSTDQCSKSLESFISIEGKIKRLRKANNVISQTVGYRDEEWNLLDVLSFVEGKYGQDKFIKMFKVDSVGAIRMNIPQIYSSGLNRTFLNKVEHVISIAYMAALMDKKMQETWVYWNERCGKKIRKAID
jgi:hypothetical protein